MSTFCEQKFDNLSILDVSNTSEDIVKGFECELVGGTDDYSEHCRESRHQRIMRANEAFIEWEKLSHYLENLQSTMLKENIHDIKVQLRDLVDGYKPWVEKSTTNQIENVVSIVKS